MQSTRNGSVVRFRRIVIGPAAVAAVIIGLTGCSTAGEEQGATVEDVQDADDGAGSDAGALLGQTVTLSADVEEVISPSAFTIAGGDVESLLIVGADAPSNLQEGGLVQVTGEVAQFTVVEAEEFVGSDLDDGLYADYVQEPYIQAEMVEVQ